MISNVHIFLSHNREKTENYTSTLYAVNPNVRVCVNKCTFPNDILKFCIPFIWVLHTIYIYILEERVDWKKQFLFPVHCDVCHSGQCYFKAVPKAKDAIPSPSN